MSHDIYESDSTIYDAPPVCVRPVPQPEAIERSTVVERVNRRLSQHPVWAGVAVGFCMFLGANVFNSYNKQVEQPYIDSMQNYRLDAIEKDVADTLKTVSTIHQKQTTQTATLKRIEESLK